MLQSAVARWRVPHPGNASHVKSLRRTKSRLKPAASTAPRANRHGCKHQHARVAPKGMTAGRVVALTLTSVLAFTGAAIPTAALSLRDNIESVATEVRLVTVDRPEVVVVGEPESQQPLNILVLGTDGRGTPENVALGGDYVGGERSDTTIVMHISADRQNVAMISIPRDSVVDIPACPTTTKGKYTRPHPNTRFNAAFAYGYDLGGDTGSGALCAMHTVEQITNVRLDGFIAVDFNGFKNMVDALGGVEMCIPNAIYAPMADGLRLQAGYQSLDGWQALQFARARTGQGLGDGSDLRRIERQQDLLAAIALNVLSRNLLTDAPALLQFLAATTSSLTMSDNLTSLTGLSGLAGSLQNVTPGNIEFLTVPNKLNPENPNTVVWLSEADDVWETLRQSTWGTGADADLAAGMLEAEAAPGGSDSESAAANLNGVSTSNSSGSVALPTTAADNRPTQNACR